ncbi:low molecular weight protein-tyrosine-phosphatase [Flavobacterium sp. 7A]|uniref:low molecular weight protein-tyrosine-phosphatase n=1 Tax=Flavobacterium sp. 7A TaxID=2940571 RepID=UPI002227FA90|nr:low molecular weight protein-tyrosine-phosphatase [Flavobacterium sp. 7A]MCW2120753.1 protein-tyrosine phosphatase [Flavobacterium sp. 7A]
MSVKILMVCLGNICRSPLAEGILASKLPAATFSVESAGTGSWHIGHSPDKRSIEIAKKNKLDISKQKGRQFETTDFETFDFIYVMDHSNYKDVVAMAKNEKQISKVKMILNELFPTENVDVPDPYYGTDNGFEMVYKMLDEACDIISEKLIAQQN